MKKKYEYLDKINFPSDLKKISEGSGHLGIAGGQYLDLSYEHKKISEKKNN